MPRRSYLSSRIDSVRLVAALGLIPLKLVDEGTWTPGEHYWGEDDEPLEQWTKPIITCGARQMFDWSRCCPGGTPPTRTGRVEQIQEHDGAIEAAVQGTIPTERSQTWSTSSWNMRWVTAD